MLWLCVHVYARTGILHYLQEGGEHVERGKIEGQPLFLRLHSTRQILALVTHDMMLTQYSVNTKGETTVLVNVSSTLSACHVESFAEYVSVRTCTYTPQAKLSGRQKLTCLDWTYEGVLGSCAGEEVIR